VAGTADTTGLKIVSLKKTGKNCSINGSSYDSHYLQVIGTVSTLVHVQHPEETLYRDVQRKPGSGAT
jgi:hypothetical protein